MTQPVLNSKAIIGELCRRSLKEFVKRAWPIVEPGKEFIDGKHIDAICLHLEAVWRGKIRNLLITVPPRMSKSTIVSVMYPAWCWAQDPTQQFLCASHSMDLATRDNVKTRRLIESAWYQETIIGTLPEKSKKRFKLSGDQNQKTKFENDKSGYRQAVSVEGQVTGAGGDQLLIDDPSNAAEYQSEANLSNTIEWWDNAMATRLNNPKTGRKIMIMQRISHKDLAGHVLKQGGWVHLNLPMEYVPEKHCKTKIGWEDWRTVAGELLCEARIDARALADMKAGMTRYAIGAQFQQDPSPEEGGIFKRDYWKLWDGSLPEFEAIVQSWDTALEAGEQNDYSARTDWGIFLHKFVLGEEHGKRKGREEWRYCMMLLDFRQKRLEGPELRKEAIEQFHFRKPDYIIIERKASGHNLIQEMKRAGLPVVPFDPKGRDKIARANTAAIVWEQDAVFYPPKKYAEELIETMARFPNDEHDDGTDSAVQAGLFLRKKFWVQFAGEADDEERPPEESGSIY